MKQKIKMPEEFREIKENDIYTTEGVESYSDDDAISNVEEGFMIGYLAA